MLDKLTHIESGEKVSDTISCHKSAKRLYNHLSRQFGAVICEDVSVHHNVRVTEDGNITVTLRFVRGDNGEWQNVVSVERK